MITGKDLINEYQRMYSENEEIQEERLYSTGDNELDDLLERAFCEGYEYAQKEFARYKDPTVRFQKLPDVKNLVKVANENGIKGKNMDQISKNTMKKANLKELFDTDNKGEIRNALRKNGKEIAKAAGISGSNGAWRARKIGADKQYLIKKGLM